MSRATAHHAGGPAPKVAGLALAAVGVVYGDIGTSPLYAVKECFSGEHGAALTHENILGILSLIVWSLFFVVVVKYLTVVMRADYDGEGGILALLALATKGRPPQLRLTGTTVLVLLGLFGAALLYGDGVITPAISVLSAVEGLSVATNIFDPYIQPITIAILIALFAVQKEGMGGIGQVFGPVMVLWFVAIGGLGLVWIFKVPAILDALDPRHAVEFFIRNGRHGFLVLGAVVLCITGGEALYADMGHFGVRPIRYAWYGLVLPALLLNYLGQGALLLARGTDALDNPFYGLVPSFALYPMVAIAASATVIASQALISGAFSLTNQAVQLGYLPRMNVVHTSSETEGQIYIPTVRNLMMIGSVALVIGFRHSSALAAAYGIAVTGTMAITTVLFFVVMKERWGVWAAGGLSLLFITFDLAFFSSNVAKIPAGGWVSLAMAGALFLVMYTWRRGRLILRDQARANLRPLEQFFDEMNERNVPRVPGTAVFLSLNPNVVPMALVHNYTHNKVIHQQVALVSVQMERVPEVAPEERLEVTRLASGFVQIIARCGFMELPNVPMALLSARDHGFEVGEDVSYYLSREALVSTGKSKLPKWQRSIFTFLSRNAHSVTDFFGIPTDRVVEMGMQVEI